MELSSRAMDYIWEGCSNQQFRCEVDDETAVVANTAILWEDECIHACDSGSGKDANNGSASPPVSGGDWDAGMLPAQFKKFKSSTKSCAARRPVYTFLLKLPRRTISLWIDFHNSS